MSRWANRQVFRKPRGLSRRQAHRRLLLHRRFSRKQGMPMSMNCSIDLGPVSQWIRKMNRLPATLTHRPIPIRKGDKATIRWSTWTKDQIFRSRTLSLPPSKRTMLDRTMIHRHQIANQRFWQSWRRRRRKWTPPAPPSHQQHLSSQLWKRC